MDVETEGGFCALVVDGSMCNQGVVLIVIHEVLVMLTAMVIQGPVGLTPVGEVAEAAGDPVGAVPLQTRASLGLERLAFFVPTVLLGTWGGVGQLIG